MYRFPDPLDEAALKGLIADKRFQDPRHPEHEFFKMFVAKAFDLVHPDARRDAAGNAVLNPREPAQARTVEGLGAFQPMARTAETREERKTGIADFFPQANPVAPLTWPVRGREIRNDDRGEGRFGPGLRTDQAGRPRDHEGLDILAQAGEPVVSPMTGRVVREFDVYGDEKIRGIAIAREDGSVARVLYVQASPNLRVGAQVKAGDLIGHVQDIAGYHAKPGKAAMRNHVHFEVLTRRDGSEKQPGAFNPDERKRDYEPRDPWRPLHENME